MCLLAKEYNIPYMQQVLQDFIGKYKERVDLGIAEVLKQRLAEVKAISPHLERVLVAMKELSIGGKRLRALLVILGYQMSGKEVNDEVIKAAVTMEIFHLGLLIQDDFMDHDQLRRGVKTVYARFDDLHVGESVAMLAGDYTFGWGIENLSQLKMDPSRVNAAMAVWGKYFTRVGYGQTLDGMDIADDQTILQILAIKSGEYSCVLPLLLGATLCGATQKLLDNLEKYGMELGWVFQLRDDYLGYDKDMTKKGKKTFATMYGKDKTEKATNEHMLKAKGLSMGNEILESLVEWMATREN